MTAGTGRDCLLVSAGALAAELASSTAPVLLDVRSALPSAVSSPRGHGGPISGGTLNGVMTWMDDGAVMIGPSSAPLACMMIWQARCMSRRRSW